jgi:hypothetical protein
MKFLDDYVNLRDQVIASAAKQSLPGKEIASSPAAPCKDNLYQLLTLPPERHFPLWRFPVFGATPAIFFQINLSGAVKFYAFGFKEPPLFFDPDYISTDAYPARRIDDALPGYGPRQRLRQVP